jgi:hypothetical protein
MKKIIVLLAIGIFAVLSNFVFAQCTSFAKKKCLPNISPYTHNGQLTSSYMGVGESAEIKMIFYSNQEYRLMICHQPNIEGVYFKLKDAEHRDIYSSKDKDSQVFDFNVKTTQEMYVEVIVPEPKGGISKGAHDIADAGCVAIVVGFKTH